MSNLELSVSNLNTVLSKFYLGKVLANLRGVKEATVRFGETGTGRHPNYERIFPNREPHTIRGSTHKSYDGTKEFNKENTSIPFTFEEITNAYNNAK